MEARGKLCIGACCPTVLLVGLLVCAVPAAPVSAQCPFTDDFERPDSNTVGNGWVEVEKQSDDCAIVSGYCQIRDRIPDGQITQSGILTTGLQNISFRYEWRGNSISTGSDYLIVAWKRSDTGTWSTLGTHTLDQTTFTFESRALPVEAEDTSIDIRFTVSVAVKDHGAEVDNVEVCAGECIIDDDCDDSDLCTTDTCLNYTCYNDPVDCSHLDDDCNVGVCNPSSGACESQTANEGLPCDDGDVCNVGETCQSGTCTGGSAQDCTGAGDQCNDASCDPLGTEGNCDTLTPTNEGLPCDDAEACNIGETCQSGSCNGGDPPDCTGAGDQCNDAS
ncbi:MAG: hypothetical protein JSV19_00675, partial [Phycisphaerales bacterium]